MPWQNDWVLPFALTEPHSATAFSGSFGPHQYAYLFAYPRPGLSGGLVHLTAPLPHQNPAVRRPDPAEQVGHLNTDGQLLAVHWADDTQTEPWAQGVP